MFKGVFTALVTPFDEKGAVDFAALGRLVDFQLENGADGFVLLGSTAESHSLTLAEKKEVCSFAHALNEGDAALGKSYGKGNAREACTGADIGYMDR